VHLVPCTRHARLVGRRTQRLIARRRRARGHDEPRSPDPSRAAGLWLDGQHKGKIRVSAARLDVAGPALEDIQGGREEVRIDTAALTSGRRCRRGRLGEGGPVGGFLPAPVPGSRPASRPSGVAWRRCPFSPPLPVLTQRKGNQKPQWGWWLGQLGFGLPWLLKHGGARRGAKALAYPGFVCGADQASRERDMGANG
jgi:hypothetical protein